MKDQDNSTFRFADLGLFLRSKLFRFSLIRIGIFLLLLWTAHSFILNFYTNHGQKLKLGKYVGIPLNEAIKHADPRGFEIIVTDSIHLIGKRGGVVISQIPKPGSLVKRGRKIYVSITRFNPDLIDSEELIGLYGKKFEHKRAELEALFQLKTKILGAEYDPGPTGHILKVLYHGELILDSKTQNKDIKISKGDTLQIIISKQRDGEIEIPNLKCKTLAEVRFELEASQLQLGEINYDGEVAEPEDAFVTGQNPPFKSGNLIKLGDKISITLQQNKPQDCENQ